MIHFNDLEMNKDYWYVFVPISAINLQTVKLEKVFLEILSEEKTMFRVYRYEESNEFLTVSISLDHTETKEYPNIFPIEQKDEAEQYWAKEFFKNFKTINGVEFSNFVELYKKIQYEHPEWII